MEIKQYQMKCKYIKAIKITLADTMIGLVGLDPNVCQDLKLEGQQYGYCVVEELSSVYIVQKVIQGVTMTVNEIKFTFFRASSRCEVKYHW